jgi:tetratricopeptide (TPR) repeat protein
MTLVAIFVTAMAVRLLHLWFIRDAPVFDTLMGDARGYDQWAGRIAGGEWVGGEVFYQAPLYPYFLGVIYALAGRDLLVVRLVQALVGATSAVLVSSAGARLFSPRVGTLAGFAMALYAPAIFFDGLLQKTVLDVFFVSLIVWLASRIIAGPARSSNWWWLGIALGGLSLTRENALALVVVAGVWALSCHGRHVGLRGDAASARPRRSSPEGVSERRRQDDERGQRVLRMPIVTLAAGLAFVLAPVAARNYAVGGGFYLTTSQFGPNLYIGNNPEADGTYAALRQGRGAPEFERQDATELAERALGRSLTPSEVSGYWTDRALAFMTGDTGAWLALMARKTALLVNASEMLDTESQETYEEYSPILRALATAGHFGVVIPLAAVGLVAAWPDRRRLWPLAAMLAVYAASVVLFYVFARYRFPMVPFLVLFAALGVTTMHAWVAAAAVAPRRITWPARRLVAAGSLVALALAVNWPLLSPARMRAITETNLGVALHEGGRFDLAVSHYRRATELQPDYAPAYNNLGVTLRAMGRVDEAIVVYERGLGVKDDYPDLHYNLANALLEQNRADEAARHLRVALAVMPGSAAAHNNLGMALAAEGQNERAAAEFRAAIAAEPGNAALAHRNLGNVLASMGRTEEAIGELARAASLDPADAAAPYDLGSVLLELQRFDEAAERFRAALAIRPDYVEAMNNLGIALASTGRLGEAVPLFERALQIKPGFADAKRNLDTARQAIK